VDTTIPYNGPLVVAALSRTVARWLLPYHPEHCTAWVPIDRDVSLALGVAHAGAMVDELHGQAGHDPRMAVELVAWGWVLGRLGGLIERPGGWVRKVNGQPSGALAREG